LGVIFLITCDAVLGDDVRVYKLEAVELGSDLLDDSFSIHAPILLSSLGFLWVEGVCTCDRYTE
jgi:hypothetical protein